MVWYHCVAYFFGGVFLGNSVPHFTSGVMGRPFPSPFASPPGKGLSPAWLNVLWGFFNFVIGYLLIFFVGNFNLRNPFDLAVAGVGLLLISLTLAQHFASVPVNR